VTQKNTVWKEIPFSLLAAIVLFIMCNDSVFSSGGNVLSRGEGIILLLFFTIFLIYVFGIASVTAQHTPEIQNLTTGKIVFFILIGLAGLILGGKLVIDNAIFLAERFGISSRVIGLTIVAAGTSLPELFTSAVAAKKGKSDMAVGNIVGSNIFNIFFILGISSCIAPIEFSTEMNSDIAVLIAGSFILFITMFTGKRKSLDRVEAAILIIIYVIYTGSLILK
ncbi:sodium:calcium antiporter, partial [candidate division KSB1 bacterium]